MSIEVRVPDLPESVADGVLMNWHKAAGEPVQRDENLVDIETDKVVLEIPAPDDGVVTRVLKQSGETVTGGEVIAIIEAGKGQKPKRASEPARQNLAQTLVQTVSAAPKLAAAPPVSAPLSPVVRKLLAEHGLDAVVITGTGKNGRILKKDVLDHVGAQSDQPPVAKAVTRPPATAAAEAGERPQERVPMTRLRARIAERLVQSQQTAAILTTFNEVNMQPVMDLRSRYRDGFEKANGVKLGFMSFFVHACVEALKRFPVVNASIDGNDIIYHGYFDIGIAVGTERGLVVPVLRDADQMSFAEIEATIRDYGARAQDGRLSLDEISGGTFSITNGGIFGSMLSTPIINPPQSAILGMHNIVERPVAENGEVVIRPVMYLALSYDHRIIDGREAVQFLLDIKQSLEDPARMLLEL